LSLNQPEAALVVMGPKAEPHLLAELKLRYPRVNGNSIYHDPGISVYRDHGKSVYHDLRNLVYRFQQELKGCPRSAEIPMGYKFKPAFARYRTESNRRWDDEEVYEMAQEKNVI
jgi:hypothetical protein